MPHYTTRIEDVEAIQYTGENMHEVIKFFPDNMVSGSPLFGSASLLFDTGKETQTIDPGDYVVRRECGECTVYKPDEFESKYQVLIETQA